MALVYVEDVLIIVVFVLYARWLARYVLPNFLRLWDMWRNEEANIASIGEEAPLAKHDVRLNVSGNVARSCQTRISKGRSCSAPTGILGRCCIPIVELLGPTVRRRRRDFLQSEVFRFCDQDGDGALNQWEMLLLAREAGFGGDDKSWNDLYTQFCRGSGRRPEQGIDAASVKMLLDDESDAGFHCSDYLLQTMVRNLLYTVPNRARAKMKSCLFILCDVDVDGVLNREETLRLARLTGFDGNEWEWTEEFQLLCDQYGRSPAQGVDLVSLMKLLDDKSANGCYCNDDVLQSLISRLSRMMEQDRCAKSRCGAHAFCHPVCRDFSQWLYDCCLPGRWGDQPRARWLGRAL